jgi:hypothetical protein
MRKKLRELRSNDANIVCPNGALTRAEDLNLPQEFVGSYKLPLNQYTCIGLVVACSFQQKYDFPRSY